MYTAILKTGIFSDPSDPYGIRRFQFFILFFHKMSIRNVTYNPIDLLRLPRPQGERRKSIGSPWGWGKTIDFQAKLIFLLHISDTHF
jgi:hypothetical protein